MNSLDKIDVSNQINQSDSKIDFSKFSKIDKATFITHIHESRQFIIPVNNTDCRLF